jgi:hypothetical protein
MKIDQRGSSTYAGGCGWRSSLHPRLVQSKRKHSGRAGVRLIEIAEEDMVTSPFQISGKTWSTSTPTTGFMETVETRESA